MVRFLQSGIGKVIRFILAAFFGYTIYVGVAVVEEPNWVRLAIMVALLVVIILPSPFLMRYGAEPNQLERRIAIIFFIAWMGFLVFVSLFRMTKEGHVEWSTALLLAVCGFGLVKLLRQLRWPRVGS